MVLPLKDGFGFGFRPLLRFRFLVLACVARRAFSFRRRFPRMRTRLATCFGICQACAPSCSEYFVRRDHTKVWIDCKWLVILDLIFFLQRAIRQFRLVRAPPIPEERPVIPESGLAC